MEAMPRRSVYDQAIDLSREDASLVEQVWEGILKICTSMKDLRNNRYYLGLEIKHYSDGILVHKSTYTHKVLHYFNKDKAKTSSTPMVVWMIDAK